MTFVNEEDDHHVDDGITDQSNFNGYQKRKRAKKSG